jgi:hypothetical protein
MEYYSEQKRNGLSSYNKKWRKCKFISPGERKESE